MLGIGVTLHFSLTGHITFTDLAPQYEMLRVKKKKGNPDLEMAKHVINS